MGVPQNIMCALCAVIRPDHFKFPSYGPVVSKVYVYVAPSAIGYVFIIDCVEST